MRAVFGLLLNFFLLLVAATSHSEKHAAILARRMVNIESNLHFNSLKQDGTPVSLIEYYVASDSCPDVEGLSNNGNPILLLSKMSTSYKNWQRNSTVSVTIEKEKRGQFESAMGKPRAIFYGNLKKLDLSAEDAKRLAGHFVIRHPDARHWLPGDDGSHVHDTIWFEFQVDYVYFIGGFGDRSYIGNISGDIYHENLDSDRIVDSCDYLHLADPLADTVQEAKPLDSNSDSDSLQGFFQFIKDIVTRY